MHMSTAHFEMRLITEKKLATLHEWGKCSVHLDVTALFFFAIIVARYIILKALNIANCGRKLYRFIKLMRLLGAAKDNDLQSNL